MAQWNPYVRNDAELYSVLRIGSYYCVTECGEYLSHKHLVPVD